MQRDMDTLTPLDARNSLLLDRPQAGPAPSILSISSTMREKQAARVDSSEQYAAPVADEPRPALSGVPTYRALTPTGPNDSTQNLIQPTPSLGGLEGRQPTLPNLGGYGGGGYGAAYRYPSGGYQAR